jgi:hypothetical protein
LDRRLGGPQNRSGRRGEGKILDLTGTLNSDPSAVQPVASRYTDYTIPTPRRNGKEENKKIEANGEIKKE